MKEVVTALKQQNSIDFKGFFEDNKSLIYPIIFYIAGLFIGAFCFNLIDNSVISQIIAKIEQGSRQEFFNLFVNKLIIYFVLYLSFVVFGFCVLGFPFTNILQLVCGIEITLKLAYYYVNFGAKGVGYSILILAPSCVLLITVLIYTASLSNTLSRNIFVITTKKSDTISQINLKSYLIKFAIYAVIIVLISAAGALLTYLLSSIISLN